MSRADAWNRHWFRSAPLVELAILRIVAVGTQLLLLIFRDVYNYHRYVELSRLPEATYKPIPIFRFMTLPLGLEFRPSLELVFVVYAVTLLSGALALVGLRGRLALPLFALGNVFLQAFSYSFGDLHHPEALMMLALAALALSPASECLSVDDYRRRGADGWERRSELAAWPILLIRSLFGLVYLDAGLRKLHASGLDWMNGYTLQYWLFRDGIRKGSDFGLWLAEQHELVWLLSWTTIAFELSFFLVLFFPRLLWVYAPLGLSLHVGMCLCEVACFYQFMALYVVCVPWFAGIGRPIRPFRS